MTAAPVPEAVSAVPAPADDLEVEVDEIVFWPPAAEVIERERAPSLVEPFGQEPPATDKTPKARRFTWRRRLLAAAALLALYLVVELVRWPNVAALAKESPKSTAFIEAYLDQQRRDGKKKPVADFRYVPASRISEAMKRAAICGEDLEFFSHRGFSEHEMKEAWNDAWDEGKKLRGASTITQQLAKNLWLSPSRNPLRKVKEAILTRQLENNLSKNRILELYLNVAELGPGVYGVEAGARRYFGISAAELNESQAAALAAGLPSPKRWNPAAESKTARKRANIILTRMAQAGWLRQLV